MPELHFFDPKAEYFVIERHLPHWVQSGCVCFLTYLDECHGACVLKRPDLAKIVAENLQHLDEQNYWLTDFVVMPNHVHLLAAFRIEAEMLARVEAWKRYQARQINAALQQSGRFWQTDGFDHLVRSPEQFEYYRRYIADNPGKANLQDGEFLHFSKDLTK